MILNYFRITCTNQTSANSKTIVVATQGSMSYKDNIACIFGLKQLQTILEIKPEYTTNIKENIFKGLSQETHDAEEQIIEDIEIDLSEDSNDIDNTEINNSQESGCSQRSQGYKNVIQPIEFTGFISSCAHGSGRSSGDRQFYFVNSRPCEPSKVMKTINEIYRQYNPGQYPFVFLNINIERTSVDVNVTPDKRKVFLTKEKILLEVLKNSLLKLFENIPKTLKIDSANCCNRAIANDIKPAIDQPRIFNSFLQQFSNKTKNENDSYQSEKKAEKSDLKRKSNTILDFISSKSMKKCNNESITTSPPKNLTILESNEYEKHISRSSESTVGYICSIKSDLCENRKFTEESENIAASSTNKLEDTIGTTDKHQNILSPTQDQREIMYLEFSDKLPETQIRKLEDVVLEKVHTISCKVKSLQPKPYEKYEIKTKVVTDKEDLGKCNRKTITLKTSLDQIKNLTGIYQESAKKIPPERVKFRSGINPVHNKKCEEELSKEISKNSFKEMVIVGQFNLGFIITRLDDDLFIIDQHATDEIYNFETLQKTTDLTHQKLVV